MSRNFKGQRGRIPVAKKKRHTAAEIGAKLGEAEALARQGSNQAEIAKALGISVMTFHRWRKAGAQRPSRAAIVPATYLLTSPSDLPETERQSRIGELQLENARLRRLVTDLLLEKMSLEDDQRQRYYGRTPKAQ
jgi:transposase